MLMLLYHFGWLVVHLHCTLTGLGKYVVGDGFVDLMVYKDLITYLCV